MSHGLAIDVDFSSIAVISVHPCQQQIPNVHSWLFYCIWQYVMYLCEIGLLL
jgi:hypothetical protein